MQRNNSIRLLGAAAAGLLAAAAGLLAAAALPALPPAGVADVSTTAASSAQTRSTLGDRLRSVQTGITRAAFGAFGGYTRICTSYPRPGDSVRQHARKAARRRNQVRARRAARG